MSRTAENIFTEFDAGESSEKLRVRCNFHLNLTTLTVTEPEDHHVWEQRLQLNLRNIYRNETFSQVMMYRRTKHSLYVRHIFPYFLCSQKITQGEVTLHWGTGNWTMAIRTDSSLHVENSTVVMCTVQLLCSRYNCCFRGTTVVFMVQLLC